MNKQKVFKDTLKEVQPILDSKLQTHVNERFARAVLSAMDSGPEFLNNRPVCEKSRKKVKE